jgi:mannosyl-3-phosphoglycerate phosphatase
MAKWLVSTDLDGTLLNHHSYAFEAVLPTVKRLQMAGIPLILNSSKTLSELRIWRERLQLHDPIIAENGGVIAPLDAPMQVMGETRSNILSLIHEWRTQHLGVFEGFADWTLQQVMAKTALDADSACLAMQRDVSEPIIWLGNQPGLVAFKHFLEQHHLQLQKGGRFYHVMAQHDKATALAHLMPPDVPTHLLALGDGGNDRAMLAMADVAVIMPNPQGGYLDLTEQKPSQIVYHAPQHAPQGWAQAVNHFIFQEAL